MSKKDLAHLTLEAYVSKYGTQPDNPTQLVKFSKRESTMGAINYGKAKQILQTNLFDNQKFEIGDEVLITKDRTAIIRFYGPVPILQERDNAPKRKYYGLELTGGSLGRSDGMMGGVRYFKTEGKRAIFVNEEQIRRKLTKRDHMRQKSFQEVAVQKNILKQAYQEKKGGKFTTASGAYNLSATNVNHLKVESIYQTKFKNKIVLESEESIDTDVEEEKDFEESAKLHAEVKKKKSMSKIVVSDQNDVVSHTISTTRIEVDVGSLHDEEEDKQEELKEAKEEVQQEEKSSEEKNVVNEFGFSNVRNGENVLKYILRQSEKAQDQLLDIYANPHTHLSFIEAFMTMNCKMKSESQNKIWSALIPRWGKYLE